MDVRVKTHQYYVNILRFSSAIVGIGGWSTIICQCTILGVKMADKLIELLENNSGSRRLIGS